MFIAETPALLSFGCSEAGSQNANHTERELNFVGTGGPSSWSHG